MSGRGPRPGLLAPILRLLALCTAVLLAGCVAPQTGALRGTPAGAIVAQVPGVPFFPQEIHQCGPAALATVLGWGGRPVSPASLAPELFVPGREGTFSVEMIAAARRHGALAYPLPRRLEALVAALAQGIPVLTLQNDGLSLLPRWHYAVVVGVDVPRRTIWLNSGRMQHLAVGLSTFERVWARSGHWALLVVPAGDFPETLDAPAVLRELAQLERAGALPEAQAGFARATRLWPQQEIAWLGLAGTSMALGEPARAEAALRELLARSPHDGPGLNNLAELLLRTQRPREALAYAERAVAVLDIPATRDTLAAARAALANAGDADAVSSGAPPMPGSP